MNRKIICIFLVIVILFVMYGCEKKYDDIQKEYIKDTEEYFKEKYAVEFIDEFISLEEAKEYYVSSKIYNSIIYPPHEHITAEYMKYKHHLLYTNESMDCFVFNINGYENLKFYVYIIKDWGNATITIQTLFVDEKLKNTDINLSVGDNIECVKEKYPNLQVLNSITLIDAKFFEILDKNGIYSYIIDLNGTIISKEQIVL